MTPHSNFRLKNIRQINVRCLIWIINLIPAHLNFLCPVHITVISRREIGEKSPVWIGHYLCSYYLLSHLHKHLLDIRILFIDALIKELLFKSKMLGRKHSLAISLIYVLCWLVCLPNLNMITDKMNNIARNLTIYIYMIHLTKVYSRSIEKLSFHKTGCCIGNV